MKQQNFQYSVVVLMLLVSFCSQTSARRLAVKEGDADANIMSSNKSSVAKMATVDSFSKLMGLEECAHEDEECLKRRVVAEAHLDYIYTQQHKP